LTIFMTKSWYNSAFRKPKLLLSEPLARANHCSCLTISHLRESEINKVPLMAQLFFLVRKKSKSEGVGYFFRFPKKNSSLFYHQIFQYCFSIFDSYYSINISVFLAQCFPVFFFSGFCLELI